MQPGGRTPSSILRKRAADEQNQRRRSLRAKGGRRVSFAPDDELETMHLFQKDKQSPLSQDTQPLAELANQNQILQHQQLQQLHQPADAMDGHLWPAKPGLEQQFDQAYLLQSPGLSPMSMELTNDTLQQQAALGMVPFGASENDSFPLHPYAGGAAGLKDSTHNITDNVPGLSTLVEEDEEEVYNDSSADGSAMELTGNTEVQTQTPRSSSRVTRGSAAAASPAQPSPATATRSGGRRSSRQGTAAAASPAPSEPLTSPRTRSGSKRRSSAGAMSPAVPADGTAVMDMQTPPGEAQAGSEQQRGRPNLAPSMDPTPSPLRRITRSMASPLGSPLTGGFTEALEAGIAAAAAAAAGGDGGRSRRSTMNHFADQQNKWGFVPGEDDTMQMDLDMPGAGGLGEATLHHVYSESSGTGELTLAVRQGQLPHRTLPGVTAAPAAAAAGAAAGGMGPPAGRAGGRRRSSVARGQHRSSLATEVIPEEVATPVQPVAAAVPEDAAGAVGAFAAAEAATRAGVAAGGEVTEDMAISPDRTPGLLTGQQQRLQQQQEEDTPGGVPGFSGAAAAADGDGLTTNLLLDDRDLGGWAHVPLAQHAACGTTGRGSVGSNVPTMHLRGGGQTTQLLADSTGGHQPLMPRSSMAAPSGRALAQGVFGAAMTAAAGSSAATRTSAAAAAPPYEECTTKLLADSTAASACGVMGLFPLPRAGMLGGTIAGGAPVVDPPSAGAARVFGQPQQPAFGSPQICSAAAGGAFGSPDLTGPGPADPAAAAAAAATPAAADADMSMELTVATAALAAAAGDDSSPVLGIWQSQQQLTPPSAAKQLQQHAAAAASPAGPAAEQGSEPTLELAGAASQGGQTNALEDATLEDFALPPDLAAGEERPITMPFSGPLGSLGGARAGFTPSSTARGAGASSAQQQRTAQPIAFSDFCQIVDMQFLTHIRRGTSISVMDFQPSSVPQDLNQALQLLAVTSCEVAVFEGAMHKLQSDMQAKRREAYELEDQTGVDNPPVFATVQTVRHTQLEQAKHCLVLLKKACRAQTAVSWKQLRQAMEQELAQRLAEQQADLAEQLAFVQAKLQKAQQQREYAKAFHADVLKKLAAEQAAQQEAAAARSRLASLRARLEELQGLNADRRQRAGEVQEQVQALKARCGEVDAETAALLARREQLTAVVAATPQPARSRQAAAKLRSAADKLELLAGLQGWQPTAVGAGEWLVSFAGKAGIRLHLGQQGLATGRLELLKPAAAAGADIGTHLLAALVAAMQDRFSFAVPTSQLPLAFQQAELALSRAVKLSEQCRSLFERQPLLTGVGVADTASAAAAAAAGQQAWLRLTLIAVEQQLKVDVQLGLGGLLAGNSDAGIDSRVEVLVSPDEGKAQAVQQQLGGCVSAALAARGGSKGMLERVVAEASSCLVAGSW